MVALLIQGCSTTEQKPMRAVEQFDLERFMGSWFVIASIPTYFGRDAFNPTENYSLNADGTIKTVFSYNKGGPKGPLKSMNATGFIPDSSRQSIWEMQFFWPIRADYRVVYQSPDREHTIVGRTKRDFVWVMSRQQSVSNATLKSLMSRVEELGYNPEEVQLSNWQSGGATEPTPTKADL